jgi:hypothetical protein
LSVASVITPRTPSEPTSSSRSAGPAAVAGTGFVSMSPVGVAIRTATTISSIRPYPVDAWPADRVAT